MNLDWTSRNDPHSVSHSCDSLHIAYSSFSNSKSQRARKTDLQLARHSSISATLVRILKENILLARFLQMWARNRHERNLVSLYDNRKRPGYRPSYPL
jgi:hypothetical protein